LLKTRNDAVLENVIVTLRNLSCNADITGTIMKSGAIPAIVALLQSPHNSIQEQAAGALRNLSVIPECRIAVVDTDGLPPLIALLQSPVAAIQKQAAVAVRNISLDAEHDVRIVEAGGLIPALVLMYCSSDEQIKEHASVIERNVFIYHKKGSRIVEEGGLNPILDMLECPDLTIQTEAASVSVSQSVRRRKSDIDAELISSKLVITPSPVGVAVDVNAKISLDQWEDASGRAVTVSNFVGPPPAPGTLPQYAGVPTGTSVKFPKFDNWSSCLDDVCLKPW
jgi:hypothetical protein